MSLRSSTFVLGLALLAGCAGSTPGDPTPALDGAGPGSTGATFGATVGATDTTDDGAASASGASASTNDAGASATTGDDGGAFGATAASDPAAAATLGAFLDTLGSAGPKAALRTAVIDAVIRACDAFGPPASAGGWERRYCWGHLASEILKESSYVTTALVTDAYAKRAIGSQTANDPTVGLLQIRFSSVVHDVVAEGQLDRLAYVGCALPAALTAHATEAGSSSFWAVTGPSAYRELVESVPCNVGLGAWYVYLNATGNGKASGPTYVADVCAGKGTKANLVTGLRAFLEGPTAAYGVLGSMSQLASADGTGSAYVAAIKATFDAMVGGTTGTHPFFLPLAPAPAQYCR